jgi:hypothetical protein
VASIFVPSAIVTELVAFFEFAGDEAGAFAPVLPEAAVLDPCAAVGAFVGPEDVVCGATAHALRAPSAMSEKIRFMGQSSR